MGKVIFIERYRIDLWCYCI